MKTWFERCYGESAPVNTHDNLASALKDYIKKHCRYEQRNMDVNVIAGIFGTTSDVVSKVLRSVLVNDDLAA